MSNNFFNNFFIKLFCRDLRIIYFVYVAFFSVKYLFNSYKLLKDNNNRIVNLENRINKIEEQVIIFFKYENNCDDIDDNNNIDEENSNNYIEI